MGLGFVLIYSFFVWLIVIKYVLFDMNEIVLGVCIPLIILTILSKFILKSRLDLLKLKTNFNANEYRTIAIILLLVPTFIAQQYVLKTTGNLTNFENISSITGNEKVKYYSIENYYPDIKNAGFYATSEIKGENDEKLKFSIFTTIPLYNSKTNSDPIPTIWMGIKQSNSVNNKMSEDEKEKAISVVSKNSLKELLATYHKKVVYFERMGRSEDLSNYLESLGNSPKFHYDDHVILIPKYNVFQAREGKDFKWVFLSLIGTFGIWFFMLLPPTLDDDKVVAFSQRSH